MGQCLPSLPGLGGIFTSRRPIDTRLNRFPNQDCMLFDNASTLNLFYLLKKKNLFHRRGKGEFNDILLNDKEDCIYSSLCFFFFQQSSFPREIQKGSFLLLLTWGPPILKRNPITRGATKAHIPFQGLHYRDPCSRDSTFKEMGKKEAHPLTVQKLLNGEAKNQVWRRMSNYWKGKWILH